MRKYDWNEDALREAVSNCVNYRDVLRYLGVSTNGNNSSTLKSKIEQFGIDISHFTFAPKSKGKPKPLIDYLTANSKCSRQSLKERLLKEGYKQNVCEVCGIAEWNGKPLTMQIHHIDGDNTNNCLDNLMMICPNCHSQTENYRGNANIKVEKTQYYCKDCGREIGSTSTRCPSCAAKNRIGKDVKITMTIEEYNKYKREGYPNTKIAMICGVTETAIRKWRKKNGL